MREPGVHHSPLPLHPAERGARGELFSAGFAAFRDRDLFAGVIAGVPVRVAPDLLLVLLLPLGGAWLGGRPYGVADGPGPVWAVVAAVVACAFVGSLAAHELAHALAARRAGLRVRGVRLSMVGGAAEVAELRTPADECAIALAGLGVSAVLGLVGGGLALATRDVGGPLFAACLALAVINAVLVGVNALPGFPLDGGRVMRAAAWFFTGDMLRGTRFAAGYGQLVSWSVMALGLVLLFYTPVFGAWLLLVGYGVGQAGRAAFAQLLWQETSRSIPLETMAGPGPLLAPDKPLADVVEVFLQDRWGGPRLVGRGGELFGVLDLDTNVRRVPRAQWAETTVAQAMTPLDALPRLATDTGKTLYDALQLLDAQNAVAAVAVDAGGRVRGLVTRERINRWIRGQVREAWIGKIRRPPRLPFS